MKNDGAPILFCHYGNSEYLKYTFRTVRLFNPHTRIILLGDEKNKELAIDLGIEHHEFNDYADSEEIKTFNKVYRHVGGTEATREFWTKFVIIRWFYVNEFVKREGIKSFWHFDSDNLILTNLAAQEYKYIDYDCTEQYNGILMNGFISSSDISDRYIKKINLLFVDENYIAEQEKDFIEHPDWALTEMRLYVAYRNEENIKSIRLNSIINNETFDDCISQQHGYKMNDNPIEGSILKKLYIDKNKTFFYYFLDKQQYVKVNGICMTGAPNYLFESIFKTAQESLRIKKETSPDMSSISEFDMFSKPSDANKIVKSKIGYGLKKYSLELFYILKYIGVSIILIFTNPKKLSQKISNSFQKYFKK